MVYVPYNNYKGDCMADFKLIAYEKENGEVPVEELLDSVNPKMRAKIYGLMGILQEKEICLGNHIASICKMVFLNCDANSEAILPEYYIFLL